MIHTADGEVLRQRSISCTSSTETSMTSFPPLSESPAQDQLQLQRLKKRKLFLKDQIALLERQLTPDIPA